MKIKTLILSTVAAAGLSTGAMAADLGVILPSLDICDAQGASGLMISGSNNCLVISGSVEYTLTYGEFGAASSAASAASKGTDFPADTTMDWKSQVVSTLKFVATSDTDIGAAVATIELKDTQGATENLVTASGVTVSQATVAIGGSGAFLQVGVGGQPKDAAGHAHDKHLWSSAGPTTGGQYIFTSFDLGNGMSASASLENTASATAATAGTVVGTLAYDMSGFSAYVTGAAGGLFAATAITWAAEAGVAYKDDMYSVSLNAAYDQSTAWKATAALGWTYDIFTLGATGEVTMSAAAVLGYKVDGTASVKVSDTVTLSAGAGYHVAGAVSNVVADVKVAVVLTDTLDAALKANIDYQLSAPSALGYGVGAELTWKPGSGVEGKLGAEYGQSTAGATTWNVSTGLSKSFD